MRIVTRLSHLVLSVSVLLLLHNPQSLAEPLGYVEVSGKALLDGATDHSGIRVLFQAISPSAMTDSALTDIQGNYDRLLQVGIYDVVYSRDAYIPYQFPGGFFFANDSTLDDVTLLPGNVDTLSGSISGTLFGNTIYLVNGDLSIESGSTLTIEPGASIRFLGDYVLNVYGLLLAQGAEGDSITFTSAKETPAQSDWKGIEIHASALLNYCRIQFAQKGVLIEYSTPQISHSHIQNNSTGISCGGSTTPEISNCLIERNSQGILCQDGSPNIYACIIQMNSNAISAVWGGSPHLENCIVRNNYSGISGQMIGGFTFIGCKVEHNSSGINCSGGSSIYAIRSSIIYNGSGISFNDYDPGGCTISECVIAENGSGISNVHSGNISRSTVANNVGVGISISSNYNDGVTITTNIIRGNGTGIGVDASNTEILYNDIFDNDIDFYPGGVPQGIGEVVTTNANGDSCDTYFNIYLDPQQIYPDTLNFNLLTTSPCIDAGDPSLTYDSDATIADMGAYYYNQGSPPPVPVASFTASPVNGTVPLAVSFTNLSSGAITSYLWNFGDGRTSTLREPAHYYTEPDTYSVSLQVTGPGGADIELKTNHIIALPAASPPRVEFSAAPTSGYAPLEVTFNNLTIGPVDSVRWYFGDGTSSGTMHPVHVYSSPDTFTVRLVAYGPYGTDEKIETDYIKVWQAPPIDAAFSATPLIGVAPLGVALTDQSLGAIDTWKWHFGDGDSSSVQNPIHIYSNPGMYSVQLKIQGSSGVDMELKSEYIQVYLEAASIDSIVDVPNDQGGWAYLYFKRSGYDRVGESSHPITDYYIYRRVDDVVLMQVVSERGELCDKAEAVWSSAAESRNVFKPNGSAKLLKLDGNYYAVSEAGATSALPPGMWAVVAGVPGHQEHEYIALVPTVSDSSSAFALSVYLISAETTTPSIYYISAPDSGYSVDNLAPSVPLGLAVMYNTGSGNVLEWQESEDEDFQYFNIYRDSDPDFVISPGNKVHSTTGTGWTDPEYDGSQVRYKITAIDFNGNESDAGSPDITTEADLPVIPESYALMQNIPNPFNPITTIQYTVKRGGGHVSLRIFDVSGRLVRMLVDDRQTEGYKSITWDGINDKGQQVASGVYFYRLVAGNFVQTKKMVLLR